MNLNKLPIQLIYIVQRMIMKIRIKDFEEIYKYRIIIDRHNVCTIPITLGLINRKIILEVLFDVYDFICRIIDENPIGFEYPSTQYWYHKHPLYIKEHGYAFFPNYPGINRGQWKIFWKPIDKELPYNCYPGNYLNKLKTQGNITEYNRINSEYPKRILIWDLRYKQ